MPKHTGYCPNTHLKLKKKKIKNPASLLPYLVSGTYRSFCSKEVKEFLPDFPKALYPQADECERGSELFWCCPSCDPTLKQFYPSQHCPDPVFPPGRGVDGAGVGMMNFWRIPSGIRPGCDGFPTSAAPGQTWKTRPGPAAPQTNTKPRDNAWKSFTLGTGLCSCSFPAGIGAGPSWQSFPAPFRASKAAGISFESSG